MLGMRIFLIFIFFYVTDVFAQYEPTSDEEKTVETFSVRNDGTYTLTSQHLISIESNQSVSELSNLRISFNSEYEDLKIVSAFTIRNNGTRLKVKRSAINFIESSLKEDAFQKAHVKSIEINFPDVQVGSRLCFTYRLKTKFAPLPNNFELSHFYSPHLKNGEYVTNINIAPEMSLNVMMFGVKGGLIAQDKRGSHYQFTFRQDGALPFESGELNLEDFAPYLAVSTFKNSRELARFYQSHSSIALSPNLELINFVENLTFGISDKINSAQLIYDWVRSNVRYQPASMFAQLTKARDVNKIFQNGYGDSLDHQLLLEAMLRLKGIESFAALINDGRVFNLHHLNIAEIQNHFINYIPTLDMYLDSTAKYTPFGSLPFSELGKSTLLLNLDVLGKTPDLSADENDIALEGDIQFKENAVVFIKNHYVMKGAVASFYRKILGEPISALKPLFSGSDNVNVVKISLFNMDDVEKPLLIDEYLKVDTTSFNAKNRSELISMLTGLGAIGNFFSTHTEVPRKFPYLCVPFLFREHHSVSFSDGINLIQVPEDIVYMKKNVRYQSISRLNGNVLNIDTVLSNDRPAVVCEP